MADIWVVLYSLLLEGKKNPVYRGPLKTNYTKATFIRKKKKEEITYHLPFGLIPHSIFADPSREMLDDLDILQGRGGGGCWQTNKQTDVLKTNLKT